MAGGDPAITLDLSPVDSMEAVHGDVEYVGPSPSNQRLLLEAAIGKWREAAILYGRSKSSVVTLRIEAAICAVRVAASRHTVWPSPASIAVEVQGGGNKKPSPAPVVSYRIAALENASRVCEMTKSLNLPERVRLLMSLTSLLLDLAAPRQALLRLIQLCLVERQAGAWPAVYILALLVAPSFHLGPSVFYPGDAQMAASHNTVTDTHTPTDILPDSSLSPIEAMLQTRRQRAPALKKHWAKVRLCRVDSDGLNSCLPSLSPHSSLGGSCNRNCWSAAQSYFLRLCGESVKQMGCMRRCVWYAWCELLLLQSSKTPHEQMTALNEMSQIASTVVPPMRAPPVFILKSENISLSKILTGSVLYKKEEIWLQDTHTNTTTDNRIPVNSELLTFHGPPAIGCRSTGRLPPPPIPILCSIIPQIDGRLNLQHRLDLTSASARLTRVSNKELETHCAYEFAFTSVTHKSEKFRILSKNTADQRSQRQRGLLERMQSDVEGRTQRTVVDPFMFAPWMKKKKTSSDGFRGVVAPFSIIVGEKIQLLCKLRNPLSVPLMLDAVRVVTRGASCECFPLSVWVPPGVNTRNGVGDDILNSSSCETAQVCLVLQPLEAGRVFICGIEFSNASIEFTQLLWVDKGVGIESTDSGGGTAWLNERTRELDEACASVGLLEGRSTAADVLDMLDPNALTTYTSVAIDVLLPLPLFEAALVHTETDVGSRCTHTHTHNYSRGEGTDITPNNTVRMNQTMRRDKKLIQSQSGLNLEQHTHTHTHTHMLV
eukprot:GHVR01015230.1.p1 GENE.GHVR01015230.1~~GHVR01015230.1.p1  ORF type:complete len:772 (+),score=223.28 GHVR01015230.1:1374-3689(+)